MSKAMASEISFNEDLRSTNREDSQPTLTKKDKRPSGAFVGQKPEQEGIPSDFPDFDNLPEFLRIGPWSPSAYIFIISFGIWLLSSYGSASQAFSELDFSSLTLIGSEDQLKLSAAAVYCCGIVAYVVRNYGLIPFVSYTMTSYVLLAIRLSMHALGFVNVAEVLRFPVLVMNFVTTTVWWTVLVPVLLAACPGGKDGRWRFIKFNFSFFLLNVHLLNLPISMWEHRTTWRPLMFGDLWVGLAVAFAYTLFYLNVLDRKGIHFYIILSPRPWWCIFVYSGIIGLYVSVYKAFG
eukprot:TRINITY_DN2659_c0_g4_i2.p1 TRINITY_DN2659_c0_g4~~TRINITY_DN2659_c0_g4_i2.p1  ORF type:complete len:293 (+),score=26.03 TRINITY_DN2659_c0_g4_i2:286-1164(+)